MNITIETPPPTSRIIRIELTDHESDVIRAWMQNADETERVLRTSDDPRAEVLENFRRHLFAIL